MKPECEEKDVQILIRPGLSLEKVAGRFADINEN